MEKMGEEKKRIRKRGDKESLLLKGEIEGGKGRRVERERKIQKER